MANFCKIVVLCILFCFSSSYAQIAQPLSVHVLDSVNGLNGPNITCKLYKLTENGYSLLSTQVTDHDGRVNVFLPIEEFVPGTYRVWFDTKSYFTSLGMETFLPAIQITWKVDNPLTDHHIPLAISPFGFGTYRGS